MEEEGQQFRNQFLGLFTANEPAIRAYVRRLVPTRGDAADVMQSVSLVLWKKFSELDRRENFRKWAFGVARNEVLAWLRDNARDRLVLDQSVVNVVASESSRHEIRLSEQREALEYCLAKLPVGQRKLVLVAYTPDAGIREAARQSGRTVTAFYQWLHRMRLRLLECSRGVIQARGVL